jgi:hypothetical protein
MPLSIDDKMESSELATSSPVDGAQLLQIKVSLPLSQERLRHWFFLTNSGGCGPWTEYATSFSGRPCRVSSFLALIIHRLTVLQQETGCI